MPELPEVETIRRGLQQHLVGKRITKITVRDPRLRWPVDAESLLKRGIGARIRSVGRRAKYFLIHLDNHFVILGHLGMSGRVLLFHEKLPPEKHDHILFEFDDDSTMHYRDPRRFGMMDVVADKGLESHPRLRDLGPEPLSPELDGEGLFEKIHGSRRAIKTVLMDAGFLVGVGNIYANEALFRTRVHPALPAAELQLSVWLRLLQHVRSVLEEAVEAGGTTLNDFVGSTGSPGYFQQELSVYGREGEPCPECSAPIRRMNLIGRGTFWCANCQPGP